MVSAQDSAGGRTRPHLVRQGRFIRRREEKKEDAGKGVSMRSGFHTLTSSRSLLRHRPQVTISYRPRRNKGARTSPGNARDGDLKHLLVRALALQGVIPSRLNAGGKPLGVTP